MSGTGSVTHWVEQLAAGEPLAAQRLWEAYFRRLVGLARKKLPPAARRAADEEDVALSAFDSFCRGAGRGRFPQLRDRHDLWRVLVVITARKAADLALHVRRLKRGGGEVAGESALAPRGGGGLDQVAGPEPSPEFAAQVADECRRLLDRLSDPQLRAVALWKMEGYTSDEIAARLGCAPRTVERKLGRIRAIWESGPSP